MELNSLMFPSEEWVKEWVKTLNDYEAYQQAAATWEGDFLFVLEADAGLSETVVIYCDLWHGKCRRAWIVSSDSPAPDNVEFEYKGPYGNWIKLLQGEIGPIKGLLQQKFRLKGNMAKVMKSTKAAMELVTSTTLVENTEFF
jgi:putative sterol carrier protein